MLNKDSDAIAQFVTAARLKPNYSQAYYAMGNTFFKVKQYGRAIVSFTQALTLSPDNFLIYNNRGYTFYKLGQYDKALADLNKAVALNPGYPSARRHRDELLKLCRK